MTVSNSTCRLDLTDLSELEAQDDARFSDYVQGKSGSAMEAENLPI